MENNSDSNNNSFTFQSGYIPTNLSTGNEIVDKIFRFQSGYIPTAADFEERGRCLRFTFQSGYIPTVELLHARTLVHLALHSNLVIFQPFYSISCKMHIELYIPIWLYYNKNFNFVLGGRSFFTFQSGYIPTKNLIQMTRQDIWLYIPIWLYSNTSVPL